MLAGLPPPHLEHPEHVIRTGRRLNQRGQLDKLTQDLPFNHILKRERQDN